ERPGGGGADRVGQLRPRRRGPRGAAARRELGDPRPPRVEQGRLLLSRQRARAPALVRVRHRRGRAAHAGDLLRDRRRHEPGVELVARAEYPGVLLLGGGAASDASGLARTWAAGTANDNANGLYGFRVARVPEPGGAAGPAAALLTLAALRTRRRAPRRRPAP